jgi:outer membrane protein assembly factor BamB
MRRFVGPLLAVLLVGVAGCGGGSSKGKSTGTTSPPAVSTGTSTPAAPAPGAWLTYHANLARTGLDSTGPPLGRARHAWTHQLDAKVYAQPLVTGNRVIAATEGNSVWALDARTGVTQWRAKLGTPVSGSSLPCGNIDPSGITSTPAIDAAAGTVYAVGFLQPARHVLFALDLATGHVRWQRQIDAPGADPRVHQQRSALALSRGRVYVAYGGLFGDCGNYFGRVVSAPAGGPSGALQSFRVPTGSRGAIWAPPGPSVDAGGNLFVATGNGAPGGSPDLGNSVIRLTPSLQQNSFWQPRNAVTLASSDTDLGSTSPLLLPGGRIFMIGKEGVGYVLDAAHLGGAGGELASHPVCSSAFGASAYAGGLVYAPCTDGLVALRVTSSGFARAWKGPGFRAGPPIVAGGAVWTVDLDGGKLYALNAQTGAVRFQASIGSPVQFSSPAAAGGSIYVGGGSQLLAFAGV